MLVYANHLSFQGAGAEEAIFKAIGGWLKEQLGFGLHPDQLRREGDFNGHRGDMRSSLRIHATNEEEPELYAWVLMNPDETVHGRQWITELGLIWRIPAGTSPCWPPSARPPALSGFKDSKYLYMVIGLVGTTIAPLMQFYLQSSVVEKGVTALVV